MFRARRVGTYSQYMGSIQVVSRVGHVSLLRSRSPGPAYWTLRTATRSWATVAPASSHSPHRTPTPARRTGLYGYNETEVVFYLRLAAGPDNAKGDLEDRAVTFVTHGQGDDRWRSVVATGRLRSTTDDAVAIDALEGFREVQISLVDVFGAPTSEVPLEFYRLDPESLTTCEESPTGT